MEASPAFTVWITGLPRSGKSSVADVLLASFQRRGLAAEIIDSGRLRATPLGASAGFSRAERDLNVRRHALAARLLTAHGVVAIVAAVSPYADTRAEVRRELGNLFEVYAATPKGACVDRDSAGLWRRALAGEIRDFTGVDAPYEPPDAPDLRFDLSVETVDEAAARIVEALQAAGLVPERAPSPGQRDSLIERLSRLDYEG